MPRLIVATTPSCTRCPIYFKQLTKRQIPFTSVDISVDTDAANVLTELGYSEAPVFLLVDDAAETTTAEATYKGSAVTGHTSAYDKNVLMAWTGQAATAA